MAAIVLPIIVGSIVAGGGIATTVIGVTGGKRDFTNTERQPVLFSLNTTNLQNGDAKRLHNLTMTIAPSGQARFQGTDFTAEGQMVINKAHTNKGLLQGDLSFGIPGLRTVEGEWITVDTTTEDSVDDAAFRKAHSRILEAQMQGDEELSLENIVQRINALA